jgi:hypothetical protein
MRDEGQCSRHQAQPIDDLDDRGTIRRGYDNLVHSFSSSSTTNRRLNGYTSSMESPLEKKSRKTGRESLNKVNCSLPSKQARDTTADGWD